MMSDATAPKDPETLEELAALFYRDAEKAGDYGRKHDDHRADSSAGESQALGWAAARVGDLAKRMARAPKMTDAELHALAALHFGQTILMHGDNDARRNCGESPAWTSGCGDEYGDLIAKELGRRGVL